MRISSVAWLSETFEEAVKNADRFTGISHNHPEGIKAARATVAAIWWAKQGISVEEIRHGLTQAFGYDLSRTADDIRPGYIFTEHAQKSVPEALICALEGTSFEEVIRLAISIGGDSDTIAAIAGSVAEARFPVPQRFRSHAMDLLPDDMKMVVNLFYEKVEINH